MKKIIYSLVIMIAAGSLFTSCIEQVEPLGVQDLRFAKAEYIRALKDLRAADAEFRRAEAALKQAEARYTDAETARVLAEVEMQELLNEYQALVNLDFAGEVEYNEAERAARIEELEMQMEELRAEHEIAMTEAAEALALAQEDLRVTLRNIALAAQSLTDEEKEAVLYAAAAYEIAFEAVQKQKVEVMKAQHRVDTLKWIKKTQANKEWDSETHSYQYKVDLWQREIDRATPLAEMYKAIYESIPDTPEEAIADLEEWETTLATIKGIGDQAEYDKHELAEEVTAYYVQYIYDGWEAYNKEVAQWEYDHPAVADPGKAPAYTEGQTSYTPKNTVKVDGKEYKAGEKVGEASTDPIKLPALEMKGTAAYLKLAALLDKYTTVKEPVSGNPVMTIGGEITINASQAMKAFILGDEYGDVDTQVYNYKDKDGNKQKLVADYGLYGAFAALLRDKVIVDEEATDPEEAEKAMEAAEKLWQSDLDTLKAGLPKYQPYIDALKAYAEAVEADKEGAANMATAVDALMTAFSSVNTTTLSKNDSVRIINAFVAFAQAREEYLDYKFDPKKQAHDSTYFVFATSWGVDKKPVLDSVKFTALTYDALAKGRYDGDKDGDETTKFFPKSATRMAQSGIANIANQLLNPTLANIVKVNPSSADAWATIIADNINKDDNNALYKTYEYHAKSGDTPAYISLAGKTEKYESKAITTAEKQVKAAVARYINVYNRFWADNVAKDVADAQYDTYFTSGKKADLTAAEKAVTTPTTAKKVGYTLDTFWEPYWLVAFDGANIIFTNAMGIVLGSVDANTLKDTKGTIFDNSGFVGENAYTFFGPNTTDFGGHTDFYNYAKAVDVYLKSLLPFSTSLEEIADWIDEVEETFGDVAEADAELVKKVYEADKAAYDKKKAAYDAYVAELEKFVGGKAKDGYKIVYCYNYSDAEDFFDGYWFDFNLAGTDIFGDFDGKWADDKDIDGFVLGGKQKELADKYFPGLPEKLLEWQAQLKFLNDTKAKSETAWDAMNVAYAKAAKAAGYVEDDYTDFEDVLEDVQYQLDNLADLMEFIYNYYDGIIDSNAKKIADFYNEIPLIDIEIADAEADLAIEQHRLAALEKALAYAKENLNRIIEYLKSLDVNYILITGEDAATYGGAATSYIK